ncbi:MAG: hypothetical protein RQ746_07490 [Bacteroidales bacterium]|nr:hypothetical protein [Bacteroidales bacterium]
MKRARCHTLLTTLAITMVTSSTIIAATPDTINIDEVVVSGNRVEVARTSR